ncbi:TPA: restriction endonuclease subunit S [Streptococcus suis]
MTRMKDSGIEWIGEVPEEWGITKSKYFLDTNKGLTITKENLIEDGIPVINYGQIHSKYGRSVSTVRDELPQVSTNYLKFKQSLLNKGDFVFADTSEDIEGSGNFSTRIDDNGELFAGYHTIKAKLKNALEHDFRYFMHYFDSMAFRKQVQNKVSGIKVYSVTQSILQETCLLLPSFIEQQRIADFLDKKVAQMDNVKSLLEEQIKTLEDYRQSLIYETVTKGLDKTVPLKDSGVDWIGQIPEGWRVKPVKHLIEFVNGYAFNSSDFTRENTEVKVIRIGDFTKAGIDFASAVFLNNINVENLNHFRIGKNQILIAMSGATVGKIAYVESNPRNVNLINQRVGIIKSSIGKYLYYWLCTTSFTEYILLNSNGSAQPNISSGQIGEFLSPLPSIEEANEIADFLDKKTEQIDQMIAIKKEQIENINKQRQTLIYDYVTGKRRV